VCVKRVVCALMSTIWIAPSSIYDKNISYAKNISGERQKGSSKEKDVRMSNIIAAKGMTKDSFKL
jgi:hypothetical protein